MLGSDRYRRARTVVALMAGMVLGANMMAPAVAHVTDSLEHLFRHLDKRYVRTNGQITIPVFDGWTSGEPNKVRATHHGLHTTFDSNGETLNAVTMSMAPPIPSTLYGKRVRVTGVEICYDVASPVFIENVWLAAYASTEPGSAGGNPVVDSSVPRTEPECRRFTGTPRTLTPNGFLLLNVRVRFPNEAPASMYIQRTTFLLRSTR